MRNTIQTITPVWIAILTLSWNINMIHSYKHFTLSTENQEN